MTTQTTPELDLANAEQALKRIKDYCAGDAMPRWNNDLATTGSRGLIMDVVDQYFHRKATQ